MNIPINFKRKIASSITVILLLLFLTSCKTIDIHDLRTDSWYLNDELKLALKFDGQNKRLSGSYIKTDKAVSDVNEFSANWKSRRIKLKAKKNNFPHVKGKLTITNQSFTIRKFGMKDLTFFLNEIKPFPAAPYRYQDDIRYESLKVEATYGKAPGYYSSLIIEDKLNVDYTEIVLQVAENMKDNPFKDELELKMDIYFPDSDQQTNRPLVLLIHGGAFIAGDKADKLPVSLAMSLARKGFVVASINYRIGYVLVPGRYSNLERCMYKGVQDVRAALRYLSSRSKDFRIDPEQVFLGGNSAGGFLSLMTAVMEQEEAWASAKGSFIKMQSDLGCLDCSTNNDTATYSIKGVINMWGALPEIELLDPYNKVPLLLIHGETDSVIPIGSDYPFANISPRLSSFFSKKVNGSAKIAQRANEFGIPAKLVLLPGSGHEPHIDSRNIITPTYDTIQNEIVHFLSTQLTPIMPVVEGPRHIFSDGPAPVYLAGQSDYQELFWDCSGGLIIKDKGQFVKVVWFSGDEVKSLRLAGVGRNGQVGMTSIPIKIN
jgi:acetyl esterase/lipase